MTTTEAKALIDDFTTGVIKSFDYFHYYRRLPSGRLVGFSELKQDPLILWDGGVLNLSQRIEMHLQAMDSQDCFELARALLVAEGGRIEWQGEKLRVLVNRFIDQLMLPKLATRTQGGFQPGTSLSATGMFHLHHGEWAAARHANWEDRLAATQNAA